MDFYLILGKLNSSFVFTPPRPWQNSIPRCEEGGGAHKDIHYKCPLWWEELIFTFLHTALCEKHLLRYQTTAIIVVVVFVIMVVAVAKQLRYICCSHHCGGGGGRGHCLPCHHQRPRPQPLHASDSYLTLVLHALQSIVLTSTSTPSSASN